MTFLKRASVALATLGASALAFAQTGPSIPDVSSQLTAIETGIGGYATPIFTIALVAIGVMVGVKWMKRGGRAA